LDKSACLIFIARRPLKTVSKSNKRNYAIKIPVGLHAEKEGRAENTIFAASDWPLRNEPFA